LHVTIVYWICPGRRAGIHARRSEFHLCLGTIVPDAEPIAIGEPDVVDASCFSAGSDDDADAIAVVEPDVDDATLKICWSSGYCDRFGIRSASRGQKRGAGLPAPL
jgi:hypothetical protein